MISIEEYLPRDSVTEVDLDLLQFSATRGRWEVVTPTSIVSGVDHDVLGGLADDDHLQYLNRSGVRSMTGDLDLDSSKLVGGGGSVGLEIDGTGHVGLNVVPDGVYRLRILDASGNCLRIEGGGSFGSEGRILFGDPTFVYLEEEVDDYLRIHAVNGIRLTGGNLGVGGVDVGVAAARLHVYQEGPFTAIPVLELEQDDEDVEFIEFDGTSGTGGINSLDSDTGEAGLCGGKIRVTINGVTKWLRFYDDTT